MAKNDPGATNAGAFTLPDDLSALTAEQVAQNIEGARAEINKILDGGRKPEDFERFQQLAEGVKALQGRGKQIEEQAAQNEAAYNELLAQIEDAPAEPAELSPATVEPGEGGEAAPVAPVAPEPVGAGAVTASAPRPQGGAIAVSRELGGVSGPKYNLNPSLSAARSSAPAVVAPEEHLAITASVGMPGKFEPGAAISSMRSLGDLMEHRARNLTDQAGYSRRLGRTPELAVRERARRDPNRDGYGGVQIASIRNDYDVVFSDGSPVDQVQAYIERVRGTAASAKMAAQVASGGWCAPSQIRYDFFNIAGQCGMIDLPTFGVERGGIQIPVSPSLADTFSPALPWYTAFSNATVPWLWTEHDDILAATGSPTKPCIHVPCSTMTDNRLECYGICLTAGNLAEAAWPEATRNFLSLLMSAHYHAQNARYISAIQSLATGVTGCTVSGSGAAAPILATAELSGWDYRNKFGMCRTDVVEWVLPEWSLGAIRADLAKRTGVDPNAGFRISDDDIAAWFSVRDIRVQFVSDYQVRASGQPGAATAITSYPSTVKGLMYAAGTVARGNGMSLDLGVVRDSTLNETNDFTAAWMEECHLIAKIGHEVREYTMAICPDGTTGAADLTSCCP